MSRHDNAGCSLRGRYTLRQTPNRQSALSARAEGTTYEELDPKIARFRGASFGRASAGATGVNDPVPVEEDDSGGHRVRSQPIAFAQ